jgi:pyruvate kinase
MGTDRLLDRTLSALRTLRDRALEFEAEHVAEYEAADLRYRNSARNLLHYLSVRQHDIRSLQQDLHALGLSSLGVAEAHVVATLNAVIASLEAIAGATVAPAPAPPVDFVTGPLLLRDHTRQLLGPTPRHRSVRIMVTMPSAAATDGGLIEDLLHAGMDVMRINCAHDDAAAWRRMAENLRRAERTVGRRCRIQADLAGPKLRTGAIAPVGHFVRIRPPRDPMGRNTAPAQVWLTNGVTPAPVTAPETVLPILEPPDGGLCVDDRLQLVDLRGKDRELRVVECAGNAALAETVQTIYVEQWHAMTLLRDGMSAHECRVGPLPGVVRPILLATGETLLLTRSPEPGRAARRSAAGAVLEAAHIHCTLTAAFERVRVGDRVWLDDGKIGGVVTANDGDRISVGITHAPPGGGRLRAEKGINFPDTELGLPALTAKDVEDLREIVGFADMVALSFLRGPEDVLMLEDRLAELDARHLGIVLKIENAAAFRHLPRILLASLRSPPVGVMVARGDLAVEVGFQRLSEVQEEILWLCEAAHVPVVWATQVLEGLAKAGAPSRAEVSDAVMSSRAECVMLNKGPRVVSTVEFLVDILNRMEEHHDKRMALMRRLSVSEL